DVAGRPPPDAARRPPAGTSTPPGREHPSAGLTGGQASEDDLPPQVFQRCISEFKAAFERPIGDAPLTLQQRYGQRHYPKEPHGCPSPHGAAVPSATP